MSSSKKPRQPRLRASCDGCFLAKVKCSKARPMCTRCLACGLECRYSPSSRAGKPKADQTSSSRQESTGPTQQQTMGMGSAFGPIRDSAAMYSSEGVWETPMSVATAVTRNPSISDEMALLGVCQGVHHDLDGFSNAHAGTQWISAAEYSPSSFAEVAMGLAQTSGQSALSSPTKTAFAPISSSWKTLAAPRARSLETATSIPTPPSATSAYFPSPSATTHALPDIRHKPTGATSCTCFIICLQSLQALHGASTTNSPPFDLVLSLNRKAVEGCAAMLACATCMSRPGTHTTAMLLATVIGNVTTFYKSASHSYFEESHNRATSERGGSVNGSAGMSLGVSLGAYTLGGEEGRWLELEILARELRKLEEVYSHFREVCPELTDDPEVSRVMIGYLGDNLGSTLQVVSNRKGNVDFTR